MVFLSTDLRTHVRTKSLVRTCADVSCCCYYKTLALFLHTFCFTVHSFYASLFCYSSNSTYNYYSTYSLVIRVYPPALEVIRKLNA